MNFYIRIMYAIMTLCLINIIPAKANEDGSYCENLDLVTSPPEVLRAINIPEGKGSGYWGSGEDLLDPEGIPYALEMRKTEEGKGRQVIVGLGAFVGMANCSSTKSVMASCPFGLLGAHVSAGKNCSIGGWIAPLFKVLISCGTFNGGEACCLGFGPGFLKSNGLEYDHLKSPLWCWCAGIPVSVHKFDSCCGDESW